MVLPCSIPQPLLSCSVQFPEQTPSKALLPCPNGSSWRWPLVTLAFPAAHPHSAGSFAAWPAPLLGFEEPVAALPFLHLHLGFMGLEIFLLLSALQQLRRISLPFPRVGCVLEAREGVGGFVLLQGHLSIQGGPCRGYWCYFLRQWQYCGRV